MPYTNDDYLPSPEELQTKELPVSLFLLRNAARGIASYCQKPFDEYMLCRDETQDIRKCVKQNVLTENCAYDFFQEVKTHCDGEFNAFWQCSAKQRTKASNFWRCRKEQSRFHHCLKNEMRLDIAKPGHYFGTREITTQAPPRITPDGSRVVEERNVPHTIQADQKKIAEELKKETVGEKGRNVFPA